MKHSRGRTLKHLARAIADERAKRHSPIREERLLVQTARIRDTFPSNMPEDIVRTQMYEKMAVFLMQNGIGELKAVDDDYAALYGDCKCLIHTRTWELGIRVVAK